MIFDFKKLVAKYDLKIKGIIHVGANNGGEYPIYKELGIENMIFFEPVPEAYEMLKKTVGDNAILARCALGNFSGMAKMYVADNRYQSSSLLKPELHLTQHPGVKFTKIIDVAVWELDMWLYPSTNYNMICMDVQGYELEVFNGACETLKNIDYILTEVNRAELYKGCAKVEQIDEFLLPYGFTREETNWAGGTWGDALYIK